MRKLDVSDLALTWNTRCRLCYMVLSGMMILEHFQLADEPFNAKWPNRSQVKIMFDRPGIITETEELAYSLSSLVADCGGVLGLFIGFNFLMIWDFIEYAMKKMRPHSHCKHNNIT